MRVFATQSLWHPPAEAVWNAWRTIQSRWWWGWPKKEKTRATKSSFHPTAFDRDNKIQDIDYFVVPGQKTEAASRR